MERDNLKRLARLAEEKGFVAKTITTSWADNYLLGTGKDFYLNDMCFYLWLCELRKWLGDKHSKYFTLDKKREWLYCDREDVSFISEKEGLAFGCGVLLKSVKNANDKN